MYPRCTMLKHRIEYGEQLTHTGDESQLLRFALAAEACVEGSDDRVVTCRYQGGHVENPSEARSTAPDSAFASHRATITIERSHTGQSRYLVSAKRPQLWELRKQCRREGRA